MFVIQLCQFKLTPSACKRHQSIVFIDILAIKLHVLIFLTYAKRKTLQHHKCYFDMIAVLMLILKLVLMSENIVSVNCVLYHLHFSFGECK